MPFASKHFGEFRWGNSNSLRTSNSRRNSLASARGASSAAPPRWLRLRRGCGRSSCATNLRNTYNSSWPLLKMHQISSTMWECHFCWRPPKLPLSTPDRKSMNLSIFNYFQMHTERNENCLCLQLCDLNWTWTYWLTTSSMVTDLTQCRCTCAVNSNSISDWK